MHYFNLYSTYLALDETPTFAADDDTLHDYIAWLNNSTEPWNEVVSPWTETYRLRNKSFSSSDETIQQYFDSFPALQSALGYNLVSKN